jgi:Zn-dependent protease with chaperone function
MSEERIRRLAAELEIGNLQIAKEGFQEAIIMAAGGAACTASSIIVAPMALSGFSDKEVSFILAHEMGHAANWKRHYQVTMEGDLAEKLLIELEADAYALRLTGISPWIGVNMVFKAIAGAIAIQPKPMWPRLWALYTIYQILPRAVAMLLGGGKK